ncbi:FAD binding domain-containing protein [Nocardioides aquiterrae]|uniref:FAD binding domain-containing protein n=1 Tax=Nocardioides aquiterrae TaxID=203799 RepID=A0ABP4EYQ1_9ACTN
MIGHPFTYRSPESAAEAVELVSAAPARTRVLGGGTWVVPECNRGESAPDLLVDLRRAGLDRIELVDDVVHVGATTTYTALMSSAIVLGHLPMLAAMARGITGGAQVQSQGTIGGSVVAARPQSDAPAVVAALGATLVMAGSQGERRVSGEAMFEAASRSCVRPDEILTRLEIPVQGAARWGYYKLKRSASSWPIATAAFVVDQHGSGSVTDARLVLGGVSGTPVHVDVRSVLVGGPLEPGRVDEAARLVAASVHSPWEDELAPGSYRLAVTHPVARRAMEMAMQQEDS